MTRTSKAIIQLPLFKWLGLEMAALVTVSLLWALDGRLAGYSAFIGGLIFVIPNAYFAHRMYRYQGARNAHLMVGTMFRAEGTKLALTAVGFAAVFILMEPVHVPALLFTFAVMVVFSGVLRFLIQPKRQL